MDIIGHRGANGLAPGNTRASFKAAIKAGVDWIELDVHATRDGRLVVAHDKTTLRISPKFRRIAKTDFATLHKTPTYSGQPIPTLLDVLNTINGQAKINIEIKSHSCAVGINRALTQAVRRGARWDDFLVSSFKPKLLREIHQLNPLIRLALLLRRNNTGYSKVNNLPLAAVGFYNRLVTKRAIKRAHDYGLYTYAYTIDSLSRTKRLKSWGIDGIVTNRPDKLVNKL